MQERLRKWGWKLALPLLLITSSASATTYTVATSGGDFTTIQAAIDYVRNRDIIVVSPGVYTENINFNGKSVTLKSSSGAEVTTLKGSSTTLTLANRETTDAVIEGFTISGSSYAVKVSNSTPIFRNNIFSNASGNYGVYVDAAANVRFESSQFRTNLTYYSPIYATGTSTVVTVDGCTFQGNKGYYGGAMMALSAATLKVNNSTFNANYADHTSAASNRGGAIYVGGGSLEVRNSTFNKNKAIYGGAIYFDGTSLTSGYNLIIRDSHFNANTTYKPGDGWGGALFAINTYESYIADNYFVENLTSDQGGSIFVSTNSFIMFANNIVTYSDAPRGGAIFVNDNAMLFLYQNIITSSTNGEGVYANSASSRVLAWYNDVYDNYGGEYGNMTDPTGTRGNVSVDPVFTDYSPLDNDFSNDDFTLDEDSPLIDAGSTLFKDADGSQADIGPGGADDDAIDSSAYTISPTGNAKYRSISSAISAARVGDTLLLYPGLYTADIDFAGKNVTIKGAFGADTVLLAGTGNSSTAVIRAAASESSSAVVQDITIWPRASYGIYTSSSSPTFRGISVIGAVSTYAAYHTGGAPSYEGGSFEDNTPAYYTMYVTSTSKFVVDGVTFKRNRNQGSSYHGGAIHLAASSQSQIKNCVFEANRPAASYGGAIYFVGTSTTISGCRFTQNLAPYGGAMWADGGGRVVVRDSRFEGNRASTYYGGAITVYNSNQAHLVDNVFMENEASTLGGALYLHSSSHSSIINNTFVGNGADSGGHIYVVSGSHTLLLQNILASSYTGDGLFVSGATTKCLSWYNNFYDNYDGEFGGDAKNVVGLRGNVSVDPEFVEYSLDGDYSNDDLTFLEDSAMIDGGLETFPDLDGSPADLGAGGSDDNAVVNGATFTVTPFDAANASTYNSISAAISASKAGDKIYVYPGMFLGDVDFTGKDILIKAVYGAPSSVVIGTSYGVAMKSTETSNALFEGFTVWTKGTYALYTSSTSPGFKSCHVRNNSSSYVGYHAGGSPTFSGMIFQDNTSSSRGPLYITSSAKATISGSEFTDNSGPTNGVALYVDGSASATVRSSYFDGNTGHASSGYGGAIYLSAGIVEVSDSTFTDNKAAYGGALYAAPGTMPNRLVIRDCTFFDNYSLYGGGLYLGAGQSHVVDTLFVENEATTLGGAVYAAASARMAFINDTMVGNISPSGGGLYLRESTDTLVANSIIASSGNGHGIYTYSSAARVQVAYSDIYGNPDGNYAGYIKDQTGKHGNLSTDPLFVAYSSNGNLDDDDFTLQSSSPLIDGGIPTFPDEDGSLSDIGVGGGDDEATGGTYNLYVSPLGNTSYLTISSAVTAATQGQVIGIYPGLYYGDVDFGSKSIHLTGIFGQDATVIAGSSTALGVDQGEGSNSSPVKIKGLSVWTSGNYGAYVVNSHAEFEDSALRNCQGAYAAYISGGTLNLTRTYVEDNYLTTACIYYTSASKGKVNGSSLLNNSSPNYGGAVALYSGSQLEVGTSRFASNQARSYYGGALYVSASTVVVTDTSFQKNTAVHGGAIYQTGASLGTYQRNFFADNSVTTNGGAYYATGGTSTFTNNIFQSNSAASGGAVYIYSSQQDTFTNNDFIENLATGQGGGAYVYSSGRLNGVNNIFAYQTNGEGIYIYTSGATYDLRYNDFYSNYDGSVAGAISAPPTTNLTVAPKLVAYTADGNSGNDDLHLAEGSPLIDAGDSSILDADGTRSDIGAYGGVGGPTLDKDGDGYTAAEGDCDDANASTYPDAIEIRDNKDNDCNGVVDDPWTDADDDGYTQSGGDCDDSDPYIHPGAQESCDGKDQDCDGTVDEGVKNVYYRDADNDGYGTSLVTTQACSKPAGYVSSYGDCNDSNANIKPSAAEVCDALDNDCDGAVDEGLSSTFYTDADADGYGDTNLPVSACSQPSNAAVVAGDCDETNANVNPGATEACNGKDDDCDGQTDEGLAKTWYLDQDNDGAGDAAHPKSSCDTPSGYVANSSDCNDNSAAVNPSATEVCDQLDNDCDGSTDEGLTTTYYLDGDNDGYGLASSSKVACSKPSGYVTTAGDCDDTRSDVKPGATEVCDKVDNDCDGAVDENLASTLYLDADGDGYGNSSQSISSCQNVTGYVSQSGDCNDTSSAINPAASETCNSIDDDCDGKIDEGLTFNTWYEDADGDGYGSAASTQTTCSSSAPRGYVSTSGDCDDTRNTVYPQATETCNDRDDDCDGAIDDGLEFTTYYQDLDNDDYGNFDVTTSTCHSMPSGYAAEGGDCDETLTQVNPAATESCDGRDNDCDALIDEGFDKDGDDVVSCALTGHPADCDDNDAEIHPGATEACDGKDNNCNGVTDEVVDLDEDGFTGCGDQKDCDDLDPNSFPGASEVCDGRDNDCDGEADNGFDTDGDGYFVCEVDQIPADCVDTDETINPAAVETCDGVDNDCDGAVDEALLRRFCQDGDGDGYGNPGEQVMDCAAPSGYTANCTDFDDESATSFPGAPELPDGLDNDGDGLEDEGTEYYDDDGDGYTEIENDCDDRDPYVNPMAEEYLDGKDNDCDGEIDNVTNETDDDLDGYSEADGDCDDTEPAVHPDALEVPDGLDNDCDGLVDEETNLGDDDGDGFSEATGDCNDSNPYTYPMAPEYADGEDNDCDNAIDEDLDTTDDDGDGLSEAEGDFDDMNPNSFPGAEEIPDGLDNDGDGLVDEGTLAGDDDGDGYSEDEGDCRDDQPYIYPGATEVIGNDVDDNCNGQVDEGEVILEPDADLGASEISFGEVEVSGTAVGSVTLFNRGSAALTLEAITLNGGQGAFASLSSGGVLIPATGSYVLWFLFSPPDAETYQATALLQTDDPDEPTLSIELNGEGRVEATPPPDEETPTPPIDEGTPTPDLENTPTPEPEVTPTPDDGPPDLSPSPSEPPDIDDGGCSTSNSSDVPTAALLWILAGLVLPNYRRRRPSNH